MNKTLKVFGFLGLFAPSVALAFTTNTFGGGECASYEQWVSEIWKWGLGILVPLCVLMLSAAAVVYMTSGGNESRVTMAKKMAWGVFSGIIIIVLARVLLLNFLGLDKGIWNIGSGCTTTTSPAGTAGSSNSSGSGQGGGFSGGAK